MSVVTTLFAIVIPYVALAVFILGFIYRVILWARSPVPFHIPTVCGQQKSLPWVRNNKIESPSTTWSVLSRLTLEILFFRSLFRNDRAELVGTDRVIYRGNLMLWLGGLLFHWSLFVILVRHLKLFLEPVPRAVAFLQSLDGLFQVSTPTLLATDVFVTISLCYLIVRRLSNPQVRYISLFSDYFPLCILLGISVSGILMRHVYPVDLVEIKRFSMGMLSFSPTAPKDVGIMFYVHLFMVSTLLMYFPFSKLMHMGGVFLSPTRNLRNDSRERRHINPWNYPVKVHTYDEWEREFEEAIKEAGLPLEKGNEGT